MNQLLPGHSSSFKPSVCANTHPVLVAELWIMAVVCSMLAWIWHEKRGFCWEARALGIWALCLFFFQLLFSVKRVIAYSLYWQYNVEALLPWESPRSPVCSHKEMCFDLKTEQFTVGSVRLTYCCGFLICWFSGS